MFILYDLIFLLLILFSLPVYLVRGKLHRGLFKRLGFMPAGIKLDGPIWVHAVSVGEAAALRRLVGELREAYPGKKFVVSTVTATGNKIAAGLVKEGDWLTYLPFDFSFSVKRVIERIKPQVFIIAETELWPNLIRSLRKNKIPVVVVNARISDSSYRGYGLIKFLLKPVLRSITLFCAQSSSDAARLEKLGAVKESIRVTGNLKFDLPAQPQADEERRRLREKMGLTGRDKLLVCGSTHAGEEELLLGIYRQLRRDFPGLRLLLAPRHPERSADIASLVREKSMLPVLISRLDSGYCGECGSPVFLLDSIGELNVFYNAADIVFMGGSLVSKGGHNIIEPASLKKPVLFGPHMFNFHDITELFLTQEAAVMAADAAELKERVKFLLEAESEALRMGERAYELISRNRGSTEKTVELIKGIIGGELWQEKSI